MNELSVHECANENVVHLLIRSRCDCADGDRHEYGYVRVPVLREDVRVRDSL